MLENLITDRTQADVSRWAALRGKGWANMTAAEREEWAGGMKGAYNASDLNRVGAALNYLREQLTAARYMRGNEFTAREDWTTEEIPTVSDLAAYLGMIETVRGAFARFATTPQTPTNSGGLTYQEANDIEKILADVGALFENMIAARHYCGEVFSGEV